MNLIELILVLALLGMLSSLAVPGARDGLDGLRARHAREATFALATRARTSALERGGADLVVDLAGRRARVEAADGAVLASAQLGECSIEVAGADDTTVVSYDARGLGRMASRTIRFVCGRAQAGLTFSAYGRVRRW